MGRKNRRRNSKPSRSFKYIIILLCILVGITLYYSSRFLGNLNNRTDKIYTSSTGEKNKLEPQVVEKNQKENIPESGKEDKKSQIAPEENKEAQKPPADQPTKANESVVDPVLENFLNIYVSLASDSELDFYFLDNVVQKNSDFYKLISAEIEKLRQSKTKYKLEDFTIEKISKGEKDSELIVKVSQLINNTASRYDYTIYFDKSGVFIKNRR